MGISRHTRHTHVTHVNTRLGRGHWVNAFGALLSCGEGGAGRRRERMRSVPHTHSTVVSQHCLMHTDLSARLVRQGSSHYGGSCPPPRTRTLRMNHRADAMYHPSHVCDTDVSPRCCAVHRPNGSPRTAELRGGKFSESGCLLGCDHDGPAPSTESLK